MPPEPFITWGFATHLRLLQGDHLRWLSAFVTYFAPFCPAGRNLLTAVQVWRVLAGNPSTTAGNFQGTP